jgi:hypothetical protein
MMRTNLKYLIRFSDAETIVVVGGSDAHGRRAPVAWVWQAMSNRESAAALIVLQALDRP